MSGLTIVKRIACAATLCLTGCTVYTTNQPAPDPVVVNNAPPEQSYVAPQQDYQPPPPEVAPVYQDDLSPYGRWIDYPTYGRCWLPSYVPNGWRPYTVGHWVSTDAGWSWVPEGDEVAWGGIVYHYGQWALVSGWGWMWVPGTTYAPAWVAWREGGGYCGWAPLPPEACRGDVSYQTADRYVHPEQYVYVNEENVNVTRVDQRIVHNNVTVINNTTNITNITVVNNRVINQGVSIRNVERSSGRTVERVNVTNASSPEEARRIAATGAPVHYSSPAIERVHVAPAPAPRHAPVDVQNQPDHQPVVQPHRNPPRQAPQEIQDPQYAPNVHDGGQHPPENPVKKPKPKKLPSGQDAPDHEDKNANPK